MQEQQIEPQDSPSNVAIIPHIEENIPLPKNSHEALPDMSNETEVLRRAQTIKELSDITGEEIVPDAKNRMEAEEIAKDIINNPEKKQEYMQYANETMAYLGGLVGTYNHMLVKDLAELKLYVVSKLVDVVEHTENHKERIAALRSIGEVDGVDAFKKKTEVTHKMESMEEVEKELLSMLKDFKEQGLLKPAPETIEADYTMSREEIDAIDEEMKEHIGAHDVDGRGE